MTSEPSAATETPARRPFWLRIAAVKLRLLLWTSAVIAWLWAFGSFVFAPGWPVWLSITVAVLWVILPPLTWILVSRRFMFVAAALGVGLAFTCQMMLTPSNDRAWIDYQARVPRPIIAGDTVRITNVRNAFYRSETDYDLRWEERTYDLAAVRTVDFIVVIFGAWRGPAHTMLSFGFTNGDYLVVSVEIRRETGEDFDALRGFYRNYEIMYVIGTEQDLVYLRAAVQDEKVYVYPVRADTEHVRNLLASMLQDAGRLADNPAFYNTAWNQCNTSIVRQYEKLSGNRLPPSLRILLPGYSDTLAYELGLIDFDGPFEQARTRFRIDGRAAWCDDSREWSRQIRSE